MAQGSVTWPRIKFQICQIQLSFLLSSPFAFFPTSHGEPTGRWVIRKGLKFLASQLEYRLSSYHHPRGWIGWENHRAGLGGIKRELNRHLLSHILPHVPTPANPSPWGELDQPAPSRASIVLYDHAVRMFCTFSTRIWILIPPSDTNHLRTQH